MPPYQSPPLDGVELVRRYRLAAPLGRGGSGEVYRAVDARLGREVAIKVFPLHGATNDEIRQYAAEARVLAGLSHPGLVALLDVGADSPARVGPVAFLVTELVDGRTLRDTLDDGALDPTLAADVGLQLARALAHAHGAGVVHRDVKPSNVLVAPGRGFGGSGEGPWLPVVLADFGIARVTEPGVAPESITSGTAGYVSPEQALGRDAGPGSDVYSLGLVLLECLTGRRAYPGDPLSSSLARLLEPVDVPDEFGADWARLIGAMTSLDPEERPATTAVAAELRALRRTEQPSG